MQPTRIALLSLVLLSPASCKRPEAAPGPAPPAATNVSVTRPKPLATLPNAPFPVTIANFALAMSSAQVVARCRQLGGLPRPFHQGVTCRVRPETSATTLDIPFAVEAVSAWLCEQAVCGIVLHIVPASQQQLDHVWRVIAEKYGTPHYRAEHQQGCQPQVGNTQFTATAERWYWNGNEGQGRALLLNLGCSTPHDRTAYVTVAYYDGKGIAQLEAELRRGPPNY
jgi:hypothetical protein